MLEELVGSTWHRFITKRADTSYPDAIIYLDDVRYTAGIFFRALGAKVVCVSRMQPNPRYNASQVWGDKTQYALAR